MAIPDTSHKIIALYLLKRSSLPLSNAVLCGFFVDEGYLDYFNARTVIADLLSGEMIAEIPKSNTTLYELTPLGARTLSAMKDRINDQNALDVTNYLSANSIAIQKDCDLIANYDRATFGGYLVHLRALEEEVPIIDLHLTVSSEDIARTICTNWPIRYEELYSALMDSLI